MNNDLTHYNRLAYAKFGTPDKAKDLLRWIGINKPLVIDGRLSFDCPICKRGSSLQPNGMEWVVVCANRCFAHNGGRFRPRLTGLVEAFLPDYLSPSDRMDSAKNLVINAVSEYHGIQISNPVTQCVFYPWRVDAITQYHEKRRLLTSIVIPDLLHDDDTRAGLALAVKLGVLPVELSIPSKQNLRGGTGIIIGRRGLVETEQ